MKTFYDILENTPTLETRTDQNIWDELDRKVESQYVSNIRLPEFQDTFHHLFLSNHR